MLSVNLPSASKASVCAVPSSSFQVALATPDRLSSSCPVSVRLALTAAAVALATTVGACVSLLSANLASTASPTCLPRSAPAALSLCVWMPP